MTSVAAGVSVTVTTKLAKFDGEVAVGKEPVETLEKTQQGFLLDLADGKYLLTPEQHNAYLVAGVLPAGTKLP